MGLAAAPTAISSNSPVSRKSAKRDLAVALSLTNLAFLRVWSEILTYSRSDTYLMKVPPPPPVYYAAIADVVAGALALWAVVTLCRRYAPPAWFRWVRIAFLVSLILPLNALREILSMQYPYLRSPLFEIVGSRGVWMIALVLAVTGTWLIFRYHQLASRVASAVAFFVPLVPLTFGQAVWKAAHYDLTEYRVKLAAPIPNAPRTPRVLWVICDEWDYALTFDHRDPTLSLPEIDRLRGETLFATNAHPPGPQTPVSIPGYVTGRLVKGFVSRNPSLMAITYRDTDNEVSWKEQSNIFGKVRAMGLNAAVVGWFHPYCRLFQDDLVSCDWWELARQHNSMGRTFAEAFVGQPRSLFETTLFSPFGQSLSVKEHAKTQHVVLAAAEEAAVNRQFEFTYVHLPTPHAPFAYNRKTGRFDLANAHTAGYNDSLALLDRTLGELRQTMEAAHTWDETTVLITTDHPYRESWNLLGKMDPRIPFFLKLAGQHEGIPYTAPFNTVLIQDLLLSVLRGEVADGAAAAGWLDGHRSSTPID